MKFRVVFAPGEAAEETHEFDHINDAFIWIKSQIGMTRLRTPFVITMEQSSATPYETSGSRGDPETPA